MQVEAVFKTDEHGVKWQRVSGPAEPLETAKTAALPVAEAVATKRTRAASSAAEPLEVVETAALPVAVANPEEAQKRTRAAAPAKHAKAATPVAEPTPSCVVSTETTEEVQLSSEEQLLQLRSRVARAYDRSAAEQLAALLASLDDTASDDVYAAALSDHQTKMQAMRAKLPLGMIDAAVTALQANSFYQKPY